MPLKVTIAEDDLFVREGLTALLASHSQVELLDACADLETLLGSVDAREPDVVLTDIRMPPNHTDEGIRAALLLKKTHPALGVIVLSQYDTPAYAFALFESGSAGKGYLLKERVTDSAHLTAAIETVAAGGSVVDPRIVESLVARHSGNSPLRFLTSREIEVLSNMAQGKDNTAIADSLFISTRAVEKHNNSIFSKLGLSGTTGVDKRVRAVLEFLDEQA